MADVLLVDDDGSVLLTLAIALRRQGHGVTVAGDAIQAMTQLKKAHFDFLISDVRMPEISGLELAARARLLADPPRVILTSAYPFVEDRHSVSEAFLQKPIDVHLLSAYLNSQRPGSGPEAPANQRQEAAQAAEPHGQHLPAAQPEKIAPRKAPSPAKRSPQGTFLPGAMRARA